MFWDEFHQLLQRDVCSYDPQQNTLVLLHEKISNKQTQTLDETDMNVRSLSSDGGSTPVQPLSKSSSKINPTDEMQQTNKK